MLVTHPLLDLLTIYGTQVLLPFRNQAWGLGSVFIIDPLVTVPWAVGVMVALRAASPERALRANLVGLSLGVAYLGWGAAVRLQLVASEQLLLSGKAPQRVPCLRASPSAQSGALLAVAANVRGAAP